jgi:hypothetical protein
MAITYEPIGTFTQSTLTTLSCTFSSIPATYTDLKLVIVGSATTADTLIVKFNSDSGANYSFTELRGNGSAASSSRFTSQSNGIKDSGWDTIFGTTSTFESWDFFSYAGSTNKTCLVSVSADRNGSGYTSQSVGLWRNTAAITTIAINNANGYNVNIGTTLTLYGIRAA